MASHTGTYSSFQFPSEVAELGSASAALYRFIDNGRTENQPNRKRLVQGCWLPSSLSSLVGESKDRLGSSPSILWLTLRSFRRLKKLFLQVHHDVLVKSIAFN